jgi:hypothetical protein
VPKQIAEKSIRGVPHCGAVKALKSSCSGVDMVHRIEHLFEPTTQWPM